MQNIPATFSRAKDFGDACAMRQGLDTFSYREIFDRSSIVAAHLLKGREDLAEEPVVFLAPAGDSYVAILWGIWRAGGVAVPLNAHATLPEMQYCAEAAGARVLLVDDTLVEQAQALVNGCALDAVTANDLFVDGDDCAANASYPDIASDRRALMIFTSGTTSKPKGVITTHANVEAQIGALVDSWGWRADDKIPLFLPLHHVHGLINILCCALWVGAEVTVFPDGFNPQKILEGVADKRWTVFMAVPTIYVKLIAAIDATSEKAALRYCQGFSSMRLMVSGSAALPASVHKRWEALTGQRLLERYGMTEIGMALSNPLTGERRPGSVGMPLPDVGIRLVNEEGAVLEQTNVTTGLPGEIQVKGPGVFLEYWRNSDASEAAFTPDGWFRTGDMAVLEEGYYRIMGRLSVDIIKSGGYKLSALEIESVLLEHPDIRECAVMGLPDDTWGECVAAAVVLHEGCMLTLEQLNYWAQHQMSAYKLPRLLRILEALPRNAMGKVVKPDVISLLKTN
ncbi:MAG: acyl-CoA synthetase [Halioglobus sp.]